MCHGNINMQTHELLSSVVIITPQFAFPPPPLIHGQTRPLSLSASSAYQWLQVRLCLIITMIMYDWANGKSAIDEAQ